MECPECHLEIPDDSNFCNRCGCQLAEAIDRAETITPVESERKHVTILFSDLSGYTAMNERLDPEEVKEIMNLIFSSITEIIQRYDGFIERFIGDAIMAVFGIPKAHEDDPIRAIRAAVEIHSAVESLSPQFEYKVGSPLSMHSGINTGLVVTGEVDIEKGIHGLTGDAINLASRLEGIANAGEIVVGSNTYKQTLNHFDFEYLEPTRVKGKAAAVDVYKVLAVKHKPDKIHRIQGVRAELIGRHEQMGILFETVKRLCEGQGSVVAIVGDAGTGKSRLIHEFKSRINLKDIQWYEGHAFGYAQNTPYYPLMDLFTRAFHIKEGDTPEQVQMKIEDSLNDLLGSDNSAAPYIGGLFSQKHQEAAGVSPEVWKIRLSAAVQEILEAVQKSGPTVVCFEDLHWADPSSIEILHNLMNAFAASALFVCVYRPIIDLLEGMHPQETAPTIHRISLHDLPGDDAQAMLQSLLRTEAVPMELINFVRNKTEGNPFYLEEVVNSLIESEILTLDKGTWELTRPISQADIPPSIQGILTARIDRLDENAKLVLQKASVIGRIFLYEVLRRITDPSVQIEQYLSGLERFDLIRILTEEPDLEYIFKHALIQDVVYNGLLIKDRQIIHERIGLVIEQIFETRITEFYETLSFHFKQGQSIHRAVDYLVKAGKKSFSKYALDESNQNFSDAFNLIKGIIDKSNKENEVLIDILNNWSYTLYFRGDFNKLNSLYSDHIELAESIDNKEAQGMSYSWAGFGLRIKDNHKQSYHFLRKGLKIGEENGNEKVIGIASAWLSWTCGELGLLDEAISYGERAQSIAESCEHDHYLHFKSAGGIAQAFIFKGELQKSFSLAKTLSEYGQKHSNIRSIVLGNVFMGWSRFMAGNFFSAMNYCQNAIEQSVDPYYSMASKLLFCFCNVQIGKIKEIEDTAQEVATLCNKFGCDLWGTPAQIVLGIISMTKGNMDKGLRNIIQAQRKLINNDRKFVYAYSEQIIGTIYSQISMGEGELSISAMIKNIGFLIKNIPFAKRKAEFHLQRAIEISKSIDAKIIMAQAYLELAILHKSKNRVTTAREYVTKAIQLFEIGNADAYLNQAKETLESLS